MATYQLDEALRAALLAKFPPRKSGRRKAITPETLASTIRVSTPAAPRRRATTAATHAVLTIPRRAWPRAHNLLVARRATFETHQGATRDVTITVSTEVADALHRELAELVIEQ